MNMNKKFLKHYMETEPEGTAQKYIFLVDNQEIALNIIISGYQSLYLVQEEEDGYYSIDGFVDEMRSMQFQGSCQSSYHYVAACTVKWMNDRILEFCKDAGLDGKSGWQLFKEKEYLGNFDNKQELGKVLEQCFHEKLLLIQDKRRRQPRMRAENCALPASAAMSTSSSVRG